MHLLKVYAWRHKYKFLDLTLLYISAKFGDPASVFKVPCDLVFSCSFTSQLEEVNVASLAANGCIGIIEGIQQSATNAAITAAKKKGMLHAPYRATILGASLFNGLTIGQ